MTLARRRSGHLRSMTFVQEVKSFFTCLCLSGLLVHFPATVVLRARPDAFVMVANMNSEACGNCSNLHRFFEDNALSNVIRAGILLASFDVEHKDPFDYR
ncbi:hypothetical protein TNCV_5100671 [Trichonephila clavipes]|uniref:Uncharacterized protein n=1 Tax=Trichonephila clavipes TaxID=2585209 RepID=A0A8X6S841_TRICX|nr:hypothetical protein TNCV_5100671 [Trichonephila clavipes]